MYHERGDARLSASAEPSLRPKMRLCGKWVFDCKVDMTSLKMLMWKAHIVARGDQMVVGAHA